MDIHVHVCVYGHLHMHDMACVLTRGQLAAGSSVSTPCVLGVEPGLSSEVTSTVNCHSLSLLPLVLFFLIVRVSCEDIPSDT